MNVVKAVAIVSRTVAAVRAKNNFKFYLKLTKNIWIAKNAPCQLTKPLSVAVVMRFAITVVSVSQVVVAVVAKNNFWLVAQKSLFMGFLFFI